MRAQSRRDYVTPAPQSIAKGTLLMTVHIAHPRVLLLLAAVAAALAVGVAAVASVRRDESTVIIQEPVPQTPLEVTLVEAWDVATSTFERWGGTWAVAAIYSTDVNDVPAATAGENGRRRTWQVEAVNSDGKLRWIRITSGIAVDAIEPGYGAREAGLAGLDRPSMDSPEAVSIARQERAALVGGQDKAQGIHTGYAVDLKTGRALLFVSGSIAQNPARLLIDPSTKALVRAERLIVQGGGLSVSRDAGLAWHESPLSGVISAVASDPIDSRAFPLTFAVAWSGENLGLWRTIDGGQSWSRAALFPAEAGPVAHGLVVGPFGGADAALIGTNSGVWVYNIADSRLALLAPSGPVLDLALARDGTAHSIIMQVAAPQTARHYIWFGSAPGEWRAASDELVTRLAEVGPSIEAFDPSAAPDAPRWLAFGDSGQRGLRAAPSGIESTVDGGANWELVKPGNPLRLVAAPDFDASGVALAALFPDLVVRTSDAGQTWKTVKTMPDRNGGRVFFAGAKQAFIASAGSAIWQEF